MMSNQMTPKEVAELKENTAALLKNLEEINEAFVVDSSTPQDVRWAYWQVQVAIEQINAYEFVPTGSNSAADNLAPYIRSGEFRHSVARYVPGNRGSRALTALEKIVRSGVGVLRSKV